MTCKVKYLKWSEKERSLLLNYVLEGIESGDSITKRCEAFAETYKVPVSSVKAQWGKVIAPKNKLFIQVAKHTWQTVGKPKQELELKKEKDLARQIKKSRKMKAEWKKERIKAEKRAHKLNIGFHTNKAPRPEHIGMYIKVDENGLVTQIKK